MNIFKTLSAINFLSSMMALCLLTGVCAVANTASGAENLVTNGNFDKGTEGWRGFKKDANVPEFISLEANDGVGDTKGCLKVSFANVDDTCAPWVTGALLTLKESVPSNCKMKISFSAKSLKGSRNLVVHRNAGGGSTEIAKMSDQWQQFDLFLTSKHETPFILFSIVGEQGGSVEKGEFLLDNVSVTAEPVK
jgi:hypothetical protein